MKLNFKALAAAAAMVAAGQASAALSDAFVQNGTLFLSVYDNVTNNSYTRDLGVSLNSFLPTGALVSNAGTTLGAGVFNFAGTQSFTTLFNGATASNIRWNIIGVDNTIGDGVNDGARIVTTYAGSTPFSMVNGAVSNAASLAVGQAGELIQNSGVDFTGAPNAGAFVNEALSSSYGNKNFQTGLDGSGGIGTFVNNFGAAQFWFAGTGTDDASGAAAASQTRFGNSGNFATFSLDTTGAVTYALAPVAAVPIPAAAWLMGSGLMGLGALIRRRKAALAP